MVQKANTGMVTKLMFRLLPVQILLAAVGSVNGIVSSYFATNFVGIDAMSAVGLYNPLNMLVTAISTVITGGAVILCGKYMGTNEQDKLKNVFSLTLLISSTIAAVITALFLVFGLFGLTGFYAADPAVKPFFERYLLGQAVGVLPLLLGSSFSAFLSLENKGKITFAASVVYIFVNVLLNYVFVQLLQMEAFGLALASAAGLWVFMLIQMPYYLTGRSHLSFSLKGLVWKELGSIFRIGIPGALSNIYQSARGVIVNGLVGLYVGSMGISAFAAADNLLRIAWAVPTGMLAVSRMIISVSIGEEDRQTLTDTFRVMFRRFIPLMCAISAGIILCAVPLTTLFYKDPAEPVFIMTVRAFRILPLCMPFSIVFLHVNCYGQASGKQLLVHVLSLLDGVVCVAGFTALTIKYFGMDSVYYANVFNGVACVLVILAYSVIMKKRFPRNMDDYIVIPDGFGAPEQDRMDMSVNTKDGVVEISQAVQKFCLGHGIDGKRAYLAGLSMEEMAGNIVEHGFEKDKKKHSVDVRVVLKDGEVILRLKDDCVPFDPGDRQKMAEGDDPLKNIGIRMVFAMAKDVRYQNMLGLNVLTIRI